MKSENEACQECRASHYETKPPPESMYPSVDECWRIFDRQIKELLKRDDAPKETVNSGRDVKYRDIHITRKERLRMWQDHQREVYEQLIREDRRVMISGLSWLGAMFLAGSWASLLVTAIYHYG